MASSEKEKIDFMASKCSSFQSPIGYSLECLVKALIDLDIKGVEVGDFKCTIVRKYDEIGILIDWVKEREKILLTYRKPRPSYKRITTILEQAH